MVIMLKPDWKCVFTYVQSFYRRFRNGRDPPQPTKKLTLTPTIPSSNNTSIKSIEVSSLLPDGSGLSPPPLPQPSVSTDSDASAPITVLSVPLSNTDHYVFPAPEITEEKKMSLMKKYLFDEDESRTSSSRPSSSRFKNSRTTSSASIAATACGSATTSKTAQKSQSQSLIKTPAAYELSQKSHSQSQIKTLFSSSSTSHGNGVGGSLSSFNSLTAGASSSTSISSTKSLELPEITNSSRGPSPISTSSASKSQQYVFPAPEISDDKKLSLMQKYLFDDDETEPSLSLKTPPPPPPSTGPRRAKFQILIPTISIDDETMSTASSASSLHNNFANVFTTNTTFAATTTDFNAKNDEVKAGEEGLLQKPENDVIATEKDGDIITSSDNLCLSTCSNQNEKKENTSEDGLISVADDNKVDASADEVITEIPLEAPTIVPQSAVSSEICDETSFTTNLDPLNNDLAFCYNLLLNYMATRDHISF